MIEIDEVLVATSPRGFSVAQISFSILTFRSSLSVAASITRSQGASFALSVVAMMRASVASFSAAEIFSGTQQSFMDEYGNWIYLTPMILGGVATALAAAWKFLGIGRSESEAPLDGLYALARRIRKAATLEELATIEDEIDEILTAQRARAAAGDETAVDATTLNIAAHRLENLIHDRRQMLANGSAVAPGT